MALTNFLRASMVETLQDSKEETMQEMAERFDAAVAGYSVVSIEGQTSYALPEAQAVTPLLEFTGALAANCNILLPADQTVTPDTGCGRLFVVYNNTTGGFTVTVKTNAAGSAGVPVAPGTRVLMYHDGTNGILITSSVTSNYLLLSGGTLTGDLAIDTSARPSLSFKNGSNTHRTRVGSYTNNAGYLTQNASRGVTAFAQDDVTKGSLVHNLFTDTAGAESFNWYYILAGTTSLVQMLRLERLTGNTLLTVSGNQSVTGTLDVTGAISNSSLDERYFYPYAIRPPADTTTVTAFASGTCYAFYIGKAHTALSSLVVRCQVATAAAGITWAEVAVFKGAAPTLGGTAGLTRAGSTNVAATFNSAGVKNTTVSLSGVAAGDELWVVFGSQATTPFQIRGTQADELQFGGVQSAPVQPSTVSTSLPTAMALVAAAFVLGWFVGRA